MNNGMHVWQVFLHIWVHIHIHAGMHTCIYMYMFVYARYDCTYIQKMAVCLLEVLLHIHVYIYIYICRHVYTYTLICRCDCIYLQTEEIGHKIVTTSKIPNKFSQESYPTRFSGSLQIFKQDFTWVNRVPGTQKIIREKRTNMEIQTF